MKLFDSKGTPIEISDTPFAKGGEGDVHKVVGQSYEGCCVKLYHHGKIDGRSDKIDYMTKHPLKSPKQSPYKICWPLDFVFHEGKKVGFVMELAFDDSSSLYNLNLKDFSEVFKRDTVRGITNRLKILYNLSNIIGFIHSEGYIIADFKPQNVLFTESGKISMIDMDSVQIARGNKVLFSSTAATIDYAYPIELCNINQHLPLTIDWDVYSFAIVAYQILMGIHPFTASTEYLTSEGGSISSTDQMMSNNLFPFGPLKEHIYAKPPIHNYFLQLPREVQRLFVDTFDLNKNVPSIKEWKNVLAETIRNGSKIEANKFRCNPKVPIFILTTELPYFRQKNQYIFLEWESFNCEHVYINEVEYKNGSATISVNDRSIRVNVSNKNKTIIHKYKLPLATLYCSHCGTQFESDDDYCIMCGRKREY